MGVEAAVAVIGGGASGLAAAVEAGRASPDGGVLLLERQDRVGRKLLATGNGRCNLSNRAVSRADYPGGGRFAERALRAVTPADTLRFFHSLGVETFADGEGRVYPCGEQAAAVLDLLRGGVREAGVRELTSCGVEAAARDGDGFLLRCGGERVHARRVIVACGGAAAPSLGGGPDGYRLLGGFGHRCTPRFASLAPVRTREERVRALKGVRTRARVTLLADGSPVSSASGEVQFTAEALSGICLFELSRSVGEFFACGTVGGRGRRALSVSIDLAEGDAAKTRALLYERRRLLAGLPAEQFLTGLVHKKIGFELLRSAAGKPAGRAVGSLTDGELDSLSRLLRDWRFPVTAASGFGAAQVTAGGVETDGFCAETMESRLVPGLYACGEVLDVDGRCGGYNLQWAWSSGILAGRSAGRGE